MTGSSNLTQNLVRSVSCHSRKYGTTGPLAGMDTAGRRAIGWWPDTGKLSSILVLCARRQRLLITGGIADLWSRMTSLECK